MQISDLKYHENVEKHKFQYFMLVILKIQHNQNYVYMRIWQIYGRCYGNFIAMVKRTFQKRTIFKDMANNKDGNFWLGV